MLILSHRHWSKYFAEGTTQLMMQDSDFWIDIVFIVFGDQSEKGRRICKTIFSRSSSEPVIIINSSESDVEIEVSTSTPPQSRKRPFAGKKPLAPPIAARGIAHIDDDDDDFGLIFFVLTRCLKNISLVPYEGPQLFVKKSRIED